MYYNMYITTKPGLLKLVTIVVGLVVTAVGCAAHFNSLAKDIFKDPNNIFACGLLTLKNCPTNAMTMEKLFVSITIICLLLSLLSFIAGFILDISSSGLKLVDSGYQVLAGIFIIIAGALMLASAVNLDKFAEEALTKFYAADGSASVEPKFLVDNISKSLSSHKATGNLDYISVLLKEFRKKFKYADKIAAGIMAILNGLIYFATAGFVFFNRSNRTK